ncbi:MAG: hypothetical protein HC888_00360 [Candidatus Competibacteraceae bacterium]|nr:hypothetical protein [Candidatus Competibacteraceae bacterium]
MDDSIQDVTTVGYSNVHEILRVGEVKPLSDLHDLEALIAVVKKLDDQIQFYKDFKKKKVAAIDNEIRRVQARVDLLQGVAQETLKANQERGVSFPGTGRISTRSKAANWQIDDEAQLMAWLDAELTPDEHDAVVVTETVSKIKKKELNKLLDTLEKSGKRPAGVTAIPATTSLSISFDDDLRLDAVPDVETLPVLRKADQAAPEASFNPNDLDFTK